MLLLDTTYSARPLLLLLNGSHIGCPFYHYADSYLFEYEIQKSKWESWQRAKYPQAKKVYEKNGVY